MSGHASSRSPQCPRGCHQACAHRPACPLARLDLRGLPQPIIRRACHTAHQLAQGAAYHGLGGRRLCHDRQRIRFSIGRRYRLLCDQRDQQITPQRLLSHEAYNAIARNTHR